MAKKNVQSFAAIMGELKKKVFRPVYFLAGEEPFFIDRVSGFIEANALTEEEKSFNQHIYYGNETDAGTIVNEAMRYPMMADRVVVIVREAQNLKNTDALESYIKAPSPTTVLVVCHKYRKVDKRKTLGKTLDKSGFLFESDKLYDSDIPDWISHFAGENGYKVSPKAAVLLSEFLGNDLTRIANELERLTLNLSAGSTIDENLVSKFTGISKEYNNFELSSALAVRDIAKANRIINYFSRDPRHNPLVVTLSIIFNFFSKLLIYHNIGDKRDRRNIATAMGVNPFFMKEYENAGRIYSPDKTVKIIRYLQEYDLRSKGVNNNSTDQGELLRELVFKITH